MTEYNRIQVEYREQSKGKIARQMELSGKTCTDEELEQMLEVIFLTTQLAKSSPAKSIRKYLKLLLI